MSHRSPREREQAHNLSLMSQWEKKRRANYRPTLDERYEYLRAVHCENLYEHDEQEETRVNRTERGSSPTTHPQQPTTAISKHPGDDERSRRVSADQKISDEKLALRKLDNEFSNLLREKTEKRKKLDEVFKRQNEEFEYEAKVSEDMLNLKRERLDGKLKRLERENRGKEREIERLESGRRSETSDVSGSRKDLGRERDGERKLYRSKTEPASAKRAKSKHTLSTLASRLMGKETQRDVKQKSKINVREKRDA